MTIGASFFSHVCSRQHMLADFMPLCARCSGIYLVLAACLLLPRKPHEWPFRLALSLLLISAAPAHVFTAPHADMYTRYLSGAATGAGLAILLGRNAWGCLSLMAIFMVLGRTNQFVYRILGLLTPLAFLLAWGIPLWGVVRSLRKETSPTPPPERPGASGGKSG